MLTILGPTACGKTTFAVALAHKLNGEIISADSRQVYRGMDIGTGKDLDEYTIDGQRIAYHLIDICEAGEKYNVYEYQHDFHSAYSDILSRQKTPILCGGTGLYIESILKGFRLLKVPENPILRQELAKKPIEELKNILASYTSLHNNSDLDSAKRTIRAIEIAKFTSEQPADYEEFPPIKSTIIGLDIARDERREKITRRLKFRLENGMLEEIKTLLNSGVTPENLIYYGLEYKFATLYLLKELTYNEMFAQLETAIHQFSKRQMTWFRGMERRGFKIQWINASLPTGEKIEFVKNLL
jgi:tRNA dimethylallyltransferase